MKRIDGHIDALVGQFICLRQTAFVVIMWMDNCLQGERGLLWHASRDTHARTQFDY